MSVEGWIFGDTGAVRGKLKSTSTSPCILTEVFSDAYATRFFDKRPNELNRRQEFYAL